MNIFKVIIVCCLIFFANPCCAIVWEDVNIDYSNVYIDIDSVNIHNDSLYYNIRYKDKDIIKTIESKNNLFGIVDVCDYKDYLSNTNLCNPFTPKIAKDYEKIKIATALFNANEIAKQTVFEKNNPPIENLSKQNLHLYMFNIQRTISKNWKIPKDAIKLYRTVILFKLDKDGNVISCVIKNSSKNLNFDKSAVEAVLNSKFKPLPEKYSENSLDILFTFDYNEF